MADAKVTCEECQHPDGVEGLSCGHYLCGSCSGSLDSLSIKCPMCEEGEPDTDISSISEDLPVQSEIPAQSLTKESLPTTPVPSLEDANVTPSMSPKECSASICSVDSNMSVDDNSGSKTPAVNDNVVNVLDTEDATSDDFVDNLSLRISEALLIGTDTLQQLNSTLQTLNDLDIRNKMLFQRISNSIHEEFRKLSLDLKNRKSDVLADLRTVSEVYDIPVQNAFETMQKQKQCLESRIAFAETLNQSPLMSVYCNLNQLVADLKVSFATEDILEPLKDSPDIRFTIDSSMMLSTLDSLGKIESSVFPRFQSTINGNATFKEYDHLDVKPKPRNSYDHCESDFGYMKIDEHTMDTTSLLSSVKYLPAFQKSQCLSSPDVIIEEIIEEDEPCLLDAKNNIAPDNAKEKLFKKEFGDCKPKRFKKSQKMTGACAPICRKKILQDNVYLSYLVNPCHFYVHRFSQKRQLIVLEQMLTTLRRKSQCRPTDVLELGELIAFQSTVHKKWCRGSVTELVPLENKCFLETCGPTRYKFEDLAYLTLFLVDYGGSETFVTARFAGRYLTKSDPMVIFETKVDYLHEYFIKLTSADSEEIRLTPPFAVHCSLDLVPQSPDGLWTREIKDEILKVVGNKSVSMKVLREEPHRLIVDLKKPFGNKINSDMPVSLRDALVFLDVAKFPSNICTVISNTVIADPILPKSEAIVLVSHVNNPADFYIHVMYDLDYNKTSKEIQEFYNRKDADDWKIVRPMVGQTCVAKYDDGDVDHWYRAKIMELPNPQEAVIKYIDFGNITAVNVAGLRRLKDEFSELPCKAIVCRLAYIQPLNAELGWSSEAGNLFAELTVDQRLKCNVIDNLPANKLSVELFHVEQSAATSINAMLVDENVASFISCTSDSGDHHLPLKEVWDPVTVILPDSEYTENISLQQTEIDVFVSHVVSPSKIFVQWLSHSLVLKSLEASMFDRYENSKPEAIQWQVGMQVAVQVQSDNKWRRGKVTNIISDTRVEVIYYDYGEQEVTDVAKLRTLDESFETYGSLGVECSLMDIQPAGGSQNWTATACEFLSQYLSGARVTVIIEPNASEWPFPVRILVKDEANELVDISECLVKRGLALRNRRMTKPNSVLEVNDISTKLSDQSVPQDLDPVEDPPSEPESGNTVTSEQSDIAVPEESEMETIVEEPYLPPLLPDEKTFSAKVNHVAEDGTIYVVQECLVHELGALRLEMQNSFKCLGLMAPYSWKKGEGCIIKGSDTMPYRGKVLDILSGDMITVQYEDVGCKEKIPKCHLYPSVYNPRTPRFCIPCKLNDINPVGDHWQPDTIQFLWELLCERVVTIHIVEPPEYPHGSASVRIYFGNVSVSAILQHYALGVNIACEINNNIETNCVTKNSHEKSWQLGFQELLKIDLETPLLPDYASEPLPRPGELFKVKVSHIQKPNVVYISKKIQSRKCQISDSGDGDGDPVKSILKKMNSELQELELPRLTDFRPAMPCLAVYSDGLFYRAKLQSINHYNPVSCLVEFVDYGATKTVDTDSIFQLPESLIQYPAKAIKVKLAGFKPPEEDWQISRILYSPEWSMTAMDKMMDLLAGKTLAATCVAGSENTVFLYDENQQLVHKPLIDMGLAELEDM